MLLFPDNTVLINFCYAGRLDLLEALLNGNGRWTHAISVECSKSSQVPGLDALGTVPGFLGGALMPTNAERVDTAVLQASMLKPGDPASAHMGEAETIAVVTSRGWSAQTILATDDRDAGVLAKAQGIAQVVTTWDMLDLAVRTRRLDEDGRGEAERTIIDARRGATGT